MKFLIIFHFFMGVNGLWKILNNSAKQIDLSALNNSILAIGLVLLLIK